jgi:hypothetical protein
MLKRSMLSLAIAVGVMAGVALQASTAKALDANEVSYWLDFAQRPAQEPQTWPQKRKTWAGADRADRSSRSSLYMRSDLSDLLT